jgi:hypothetical protein
MKYKDFYTKLKKDGKITAAEFDKVIETAPDADFPDEAIPHFENAFITRDRAIADPDINAKLRAELLDPADVHIKKMLEFDLKDYLDHTTVNEIKGEKSTYKKLEKLGPIIGEAIKKQKNSSGGDEDTKKKLKTLEETRDELVQRIEKMNSTFEQEKNNFKSEYDKKIHDYQLNGELEKLSGSFKFAKQFSDDNIRKDLTKVKLDKLRSEHALQLVEKDGQYSVNVLGQDGKPKFNGNSPVTINQLLEESLKPYLKVNNADDDDQSQSRSQDTQRFQVDNQQQNTTYRQGARTTVQ